MTIKMQGLSMRVRSPKMAALYVQRRALVSRLLLARPWCERCYHNRSTEVHELRNRSQGGSLLDETGMAALCHDCHAHLTTHPAAAHDSGWTHWACCLPIPCFERTSL